MTELEYGHLYWCKTIWTDYVHLSWYDIGNDVLHFVGGRSEDVKNCIVLGKVEIIVPEYAKETGYGN